MSDETKTCATCEHWRPPSARTDFLNLWSGIDADKQYGKCTRIDLADSDENPPDPLPLAVTKDASDYIADLFTRAEFGCVLWEPLGEPGKWQRIDAEEKAAREAAEAAASKAWRTTHVLITDADGTMRSRP